MRNSILTLIFCFLSIVIFYAQNSTLSGEIRDSEGETLIGATVVNLDNPTQGTTTNNFGFYSLTLPRDSYTIAISYVGYNTIEVQVDLTKGNVKQNFELGSGVVIETVTVTAEREDQNVQDPRMGIVTLPLDKIKELPSLFGEPDPLKLAQLGPGISSATDGGSG
ncbi:MAG: carboxypeptidase-like regulatory domain-containing protein, partial [Bacteroidota bacterium]